MTDPAAADPALKAAGRLADWLRERGILLEGPVTLEKFAGGQSNPTYKVAAGGIVRLVLRRKPFGAILPSAHAIEREYRVTRALAGGTVPVARPLLLCEDAAVLGTPFFVLEHVPGRNFWQAHLPECDRHERAALYDEMNRVLAALHRIEPEAVGLADFGRPDGYFTRQIARWTRQYRATETEPIAAMEQLIAWLPDHVPAGDVARIVHGDYRNDNIIFDARPAIAAVLDWELATIGHPLADIAQHIIAWRLPPDPYRGLAGLDLAALGIPDERAYLARYAARSGLAAIGPEDWAFALAFALFRNAAIRQGVLRRALDGNASSATAATHGARARAVANLGWRIAAGEADAVLNN
jgi:aminoglycoside phosphotransferase (APT) family kinase protein